ncbi:hypothetical protein [Spartinivicinus poritis]|uniref:Uncharacterized protein n=1 Tax=Spartinivicinus poritis TaxID=2994640 RepID=A0ABT5UG21_9GAMM|nr:hypothetical protein [Spartinivicinus sp. A2-2]MDE1465340.1 hypothetical protein [Spartinivicinus sp. A2-2]
MKRQKLTDVLVVLFSLAIGWITILIIKPVKAVENTAHYNNIIQVMHEI